MLYGLRADVQSIQCWIKPLRELDIIPEARREDFITQVFWNINDIIAVINADHANGKYARTIGKAKDELAKVNGKIQTIKEEAENAAANQLKSKTAAFDTAANDLKTSINMVSTSIFRVLMAKC